MIIEAALSQVVASFDKVSRFSDVEAPLAIRAEAMVTASRKKSRHHRRGAKTWTLSDEAMFRTRLGELHEARARLVRVYA